MPVNRRQECRTHFFDVGQACIAQLLDGQIGSLNVVVGEVDVGHIAVAPQDILSCNNQSLSVRQSTQRMASLLKHDNPKAAASLENV